MKKILVLCTGNSCRSQIMHGWLNHFGGNDVEVKSAGVETHGVNPIAIKTMAEEGINISHHTSNHVDEYIGTNFDIVITVCDSAKERCPVFPSDSIKMHHNFTDPAKAEGSDEEVFAVFRSVRNEIRDYALNVIKNL